MTRPISKIQDFSTPEKLVHKNLEEIIKNIKGRLIIGTFASQMERMIKIIEICEKYGKKIAFEGRSMKTKYRNCYLAGMLHVKKGTIIKHSGYRQLSARPSGDSCHWCSRRRICRSYAHWQQSHKNLKLNKRDTVLLSSSIIPGNEKVC
jgi:ribonuclease J